MTEPLKTMEDFHDVLEWEAYLLTLFAHRLNPSIDRGAAYESAMGYLHVLYTSEDEPGAQLILDLADEMMDGKTVSKASH